MNIETSSLAILISFFAGLVVSVLFYLRDKSLKESARWVKLTLISCRFFVVAILIFILSHPLTIQVKEEVKKPLLPVLIDNSNSILIGDSSFVNEINSFKNFLKESISNNVELILLPFSKNLEIGEEVTFEEQGTDILNCLDELNDNYSNENIGGAIIISDGINTEGQSEILIEDYPLYCLGVGDSVVKPDAKIKELFFNDFVFVGNEFIIESHLNFMNLKDIQQNIVVLFEDREVFNSSFTPQSNNSFHKIKCSIKANKGGEASIKILVKNQTKEVNIKNNYISRFIEIKEKKINILIVSDSPHPDIRFLKSAFFGVENVNIETVNFESDIDLKLKSVVVFIGNSSIENKNRWLSNIKSLKKGFLWITGTDGGFNNQFFEFIRLDESNDKILMKLSSSFSLFKLEENTKLGLQKDLPIDVPFGKWNFKGEVQSLMLQEINGLLTNYPQIVFSSKSDLNYSIFIGENYWRLGLRSSAELKRFLRKTIDYVSTKTDNSRFRLKMKSEFSDNDEIIIQAEFYNKVNELDNLGDVKFELWKKDSLVSISEFQKTQSKYRFNLGELSNGIYNVKTTLNRGEESINKQKKFVVNELKIESEDLTMNSKFLNSIAKKSNGEFFLWKDRLELVSKLSTSENFKSISYFESITDLLIKNKWVFYIFITIIIIEWGIRKWQGAI